MTNPTIIEGVFNMLGFTCTNRTIDDFNKKLPQLREHYGDLERHADGGMVWVTPWDDPDKILLEFDKETHELTRYY